MWVGWTELKSGIYDKGYNDAVQLYQERLNEQKSAQQEYLIQRLKDNQAQAQIDLTKAVERVKKDQEVDSKVETVTRYIKEKSYVQDNCDVVPADINSLFNDSIRSINGEQ